MITLLTTQIMELMKTSWLVLMLTLNYGVIVFTKITQEQPQETPQLIDCMDQESGLSMDPTKEASD